MRAFVESNLLQLVICVIVLAAALIFGPARAAEPDPQAGGVLLVAQPPLDGTSYQGTVIAAAPDPDGGHVGVVINRPMTVKLSELFPYDRGARRVADPVHFGGHYFTDSIFAMVKSKMPPAGAASALAIAPGVWLVYEAGAIDNVLKKAPNSARYYVGVIRWGPGVLARQLLDGRIALAPVSAQQLFLKDTSKLHEELSRALGSPAAPPAATGSAYKF